MGRCNQPSTTREKGKAKGPAKHEGQMTFNPERTLLPLSHQNTDFKQQH